ncbi:hypothetical protein INR49_018199 [Caranx melampygus]|nr:hypothetical protein INR49_018199 [Caranx melampygus]
MSGRVGDLSPKQAEALEQFRERIQDILPQLPAQHDHFLLRWLRGELTNAMTTSTSNNNNKCHLLLLPDSTLHLHFIMAPVVVLIRHPLWKIDRRHLLSIKQKLQWFIT